MGRFTEIACQGRKIDYYLFLHLVLTIYENCRVLIIQPRDFAIFKFGPCVFDLKEVLSSNMINQATQQLSLKLVYRKLVSSTV